MNRSAGTTAALLLLLWFGVATIWVEGRWAVAALEFAVFALAGLSLFQTRSRGWHWAIAIPLVIAAWGLLQIAFHWTLAPGDTEWAVLYWLAAACFIALGSRVEGSDGFLVGLLWFGAILAALALAQLYTSGGKILWLIPTQYNDRVFGTFSYYNNYAAFIELLLPVALWRTLHSRQDWWTYAGIAALMYGSVLASGSRAGTVLVTVELIVVLLPAAWRAPRRRILTIICAVAVFGAIAGYQTVWQRFGTADPYGMRREFHQSALAMAQARPVTGFGLGTWTSAYPAFAVADFGVIANHAHSEWGQWAAEGGWGVVALMLVLFVLAIRCGIRNIWAIGLAAVMIHGLIDYPLVRLGLGSWWFAMLGLCLSYVPSRATTVRAVRANI